MPFKPDDPMPHWWFTRWVTAIGILCLLTIATVGGCGSTDTLRKMMVAADQKRLDLNSDVVRRLIQLEANQEYIKARQNDFNLAQIRLLDDVHHMIANSSKTNTKRIVRTLNATTKSNIRLTKLHKQLSNLQRQIRRR